VMTDVKRLPQFPTQISRLLCVALTLHFDPHQDHSEHTILLSRKRVNKGMKRMSSLPLSPVVISYATLQGKPLPASPA